jgi:dolichol-phosphate mannosyltransferase
MAAIGVTLGLWVIVRKLVWDYGIMGWPSLFAAVVILGGVQLVATSVIGEYIARIYVQAQARPLYNVAERLNFDPRQAPDELQRTSLVPSPARPPVIRPASPTPESEATAESLVKEPAQ